MFKFRLLLIIIIFISCHKNEVDPKPVGTWVEEGGKFYPTLERRRTVNFVINDVAYVGLGVKPIVNPNEEYYLNDFWKLLDYGWDAVQIFPGRVRENAVAFVIGEKAYVGMGTKLSLQHSTKEYYTDFWVYDSKTDSWDSLRYNFPGEGREYAVAFSVGEKGYVGTGRIDDQTLGDLYELDPQKGWKKLADIPACYRAAAFVIHDVAYMCFRGTDAELLADIQRFNPEKGVWDKFATIPEEQFNMIARYATTPLVIGDYVYFLGGNIVRGGSFWTCCRYSPLNGIWEEVTSPPTGLYSYETNRLAAFAIKNCGYLLLGNTTWRFVPDE